MLLSLTINNFTLVEQLHVEFHGGMTAITGETGTGKSLVLDALGIALGDRGDTGRIRASKDKLDVTAVFSVADNHRAARWLADNELDNGEECIIRRTLSAEGRSRGFINGQPVPMQQLQQLGDLMIDIHSQHEHQSLLVKDTHRRLLDAYAGCEELARQVAGIFKDWQTAHNTLTNLRDNSRENDARRDFLNFQVNEFDELALTEGELEALEKEQHLLANAEHILRDSHQVLSLCSDGDGGDIAALLSRATHLLEELPEKSASLKEAQAMLSSALINVEEAGREIQHHIDSFEANPQRLEEIDARLSDIYQLARKHKVSPEALLDHHRALCDELEALSGSEENLQALTEKVAVLDRQLADTATKLSKARRGAAKNFARDVNAQLGQLGMSAAALEVNLAPLRENSARGAESVEFLVCTNPGQPANSLSKVASGGELSRISLAIQVIAARHTEIPTLVFDEVDVGVGGAVAEVIGRLLRELGTGGQVICVTHLPQVASCAHRHMVASKQTDGKSTHSQLSALATGDRVQEIARMLGGAKITNSTLDHAEEMLQLSAG